MTEQLFAEIVIFSALEKTLSYAVPEQLHGRARVGCRVLVPLGRREALGLILALRRDAKSIPRGVVVRPISSVVDSSPVAPPDLIDLCRWVAGYYFYPLGEVLQAALPSGMEIVPGMAVELTDAGREACRSNETDLPGLLRVLSGAGRMSLDVLEASFPGGRAKLRKELELCEAGGWVARAFEYAPPPVRPKLVKSVRLIALPTAGKDAPGNANAGDDIGGGSSGPGRKPPHGKGKENSDALLNLLRRADGWVPLREVRRRIANCDYWVKKLEGSGVLETGEIEELRESRCAQSIDPSPPPSLTADQEEVVNSISGYLQNPSFHTFLLHGVTGSGKTEIYLRLVGDALEKNRGSLVLAPEIALSTQLEAIFRQRFGSLLAIWHSGLSTATRYDQWREIVAGKRRVVLGVRSAIFMPMPDPGLIIVDEEHDHSYKQEDRLRYHARDMAVMRARMLGIPVVLGSATPSLQSMHHCRAGRYTLLTISQRILDRPLPTLQVVDMRRERGSSRILSGALRQALAETVQNGEQALLFLNRRGFATFFLCPQCGNVVQCENCSVSLTHHQKDDCLRCHYCGGERTVPDHCPSCDYGTLAPHGFGTERVEEDVRRLLPEARVVRIDRDTAGAPRNLADSLDAVRRHKADILIGTQMIAKGHDFPNITLVGVINADTALQISDFRAGESTVQVLMQVAGRAGRGEKPGRVILQTYNPRHYTIRSVLSMDYPEFCREELESREGLQYPPFTRMLKIIVTAEAEDAVLDASRRIADYCRETAARMGEGGRLLAVLGPAPAPIQKLNRRYRRHIYIKAWNSRDLQHFMERVLEWVGSVPALRKARVAVDRDPVSSF